MAATNGEKSLGLSVRNFGPIAEGRVELRPFTVFVGPSNTGKSYLATLIYALHRSFGAPYTRNPIRRGFSMSMLPPNQNVDLSDKEIAGLYDWADNMRKCWPPAYQRERGSYLSELPDEVSKLVRRAIRGVGHSNEMFVDEIARCFSVTKPEDLVRNSENCAANVALLGRSHNGFELIHSFRYETELTARGAVTDSWISDEVRMYGELGSVVPWFFLSQEDVEGLRLDNARLMLGMLSAVAISHYVGTVGQPVYYLPADRAGAVRSHSALTGSLIERASRPSVANQPATISGVYGDYLERLVGLGSLPTRTASHFAQLADDVERNILEGEISIDSNLAGYPSFFYRPDRWEQDLPLMNASSMVSELAPVVLYLRHVVQPGETLIIEEPESALHPAMQVEFTRLLAAAVKAGIRIIITTHSEWILEELANLVLMSELPEERREGLEGADLALSPEELGVWSFQPTADGSMVEELRFDEEAGKFPSDAGLVTVELYNRFTRIANRIERLKED